MVMVSPPAAGYITDTSAPAPAEGGVAGATAWFEQLRNFVSQLIGGAAETTLTIASGTVTPTQAVHAIETEGGAAADDLSLIGQGSGVPDGWEVRVRCTNATHVVTVKHNAGGTGTIILADAADLVLNDVSMQLHLQRRGTAWYETDRTYGGNKTALTAFLNAASAAVKGIVELATGPETITGTDATRAVTPDSLADLWADGGDLAGGATITFPGGGKFRLITSTTAITAFAFTTSAVGRTVTCKLATDRTITANGNIEIVPGGTSIAGKIGDVFEVEDRGSGNARINWYTKADGTAVVATAVFAGDEIVGGRLTSFTNTTINVGALTCWDSNKAAVLTFAGGTIDFATNGANGLRTGLSLTSGAMGGLFLITGTSGAALFADTALTPGTRPSGYTTTWRRIATWEADASSHLIPKIQTGRRFRRAVTDISGASVGGSMADYTLKLPTGKKWPVVLQVNGTNSAGAAHSYAYFHDKDEPDQAPSLTAAPLCQLVCASAVASAPAWATFPITTDSASKISGRTGNGTITFSASAVEVYDDGL